MSKEREGEIIDTLVSYGPSEVTRLISELLSLRRERYLEKLEAGESDQVRGRSKECKDLLQIFS